MFSESDFIRTLPREARKLFAQLLEAPSKSHAILAAELQHYAAAVEDAKATIEFFDADSATKALALASDLLDRIESFDDETRQRAQAAIEYLVVIDDGDNDFTSVNGFDDDIAVLKAVAAAAPT